MRIENYFELIGKEKGFYMNNAIIKKLISDLIKEYGFIKAAVLLKISIRSLYQYLEANRAPDISLILNAIKILKKPKYFNLINNTDFLIHTSGHSPNKLPKKYTRDLAYLTGLISGDGHVSKKTCITITSDSKDYLKNLTSSLIKKIFDCNSLLYSQRNYWVLHINSRPIHFFFNKIIGLPSGKKKGKLRIPNFIYFSKEFKKGFLMGLFDSDGGLTISKKGKASILISSSTYPFILEVQKMLKEFEIDLGGPYKSGNRKGYEIRRFGMKTILKFNEEIGFNHPVQLKRINALVAQSGGAPLSYKN